MDLQLTGRRAIVTGASRGIGLATARALAAEGVDVAIVARDQDALDKAAERLRTDSGRTIGVAYTYYLMAKLTTGTRNNTISGLAQVTL